MIEIAFHNSFLRAFKKRIKPFPDLEQQFWEKLELFRENIFNEKLKTHKLSGKLKDYLSFSINFDIRVIFEFYGKNKVIFIDIGTHKEVY